MPSVDINKLPPQARVELLDFYEFLLGKYATSKVIQSNPESSTQPRLGELAVSLFGTSNGVKLDLPKHPAHQPLDFQQ